MQRIAVVWSPGSGKTTVARGISSSLGIPHLELDSGSHQPEIDGFLAGVQTS